MKHFVLFLVFLNFNIGVLRSQNDSIVDSNQDYIDEMDAYFETTSFRLGFGVFIPSKSDVQYFKAAPLVEMNWNFPIKNGKSVELVAQFVVPEQDNEFEYRKDGEVLKGSATFLFNGLLRFRKDIFYTKNSLLDVGLGLGVSTISTNVIKPLIEIEENKSNYENMVTLIVSPEIEYLINLSDAVQLSLSFSVQYSPYKLKTAIENDIGSIYYIPKICYRF